MALELVSRTAPGWEERGVCPVAPAPRADDGVSAEIVLRPGFTRLAALLDVTAFGGGTGLQVRLQHSPDAARWFDVAAFDLEDGPGAQVAWLEAEPDIAEPVAETGDGLLPPGTARYGFLHPRFRVRWSLGGGTHTFRVDLVAVYRR